MSDIVKIFASIALICGSLCFSGLVKAARPEAFSLDPIFGNSAVLQEGVPIVISGRGEAGASLSVVIGDLSKTAVVDEKGRWRVSFPSLADNKVYTISVFRQGKEVVRADNVVVGEVWLCSGQSNIEMSIRANGYIPVDKNYFAKVRQFAVDPMVSPTVSDEITSSTGWQEGRSPDSERFSAACAFFARERATTSNKQIGIILAAIGASMVEAWAPPKEIGLFSPTVPDASGRNAEALLKEAHINYVNVLARYLGARNSQELLANRSWQRSVVRPPNSISVWYRLRFSVPRGTAPLGSTVNIPPLAGLDLAWLNGTLLGSVSQPGKKSREYAIPQDFSSDGNVELVIYHVDLASGEELSPSKQPNLAWGGKQLLPAQFETARDSLKTLPPLPPWHFGTLRSGAWNAMIAPVVDVPTRGIIWYQGEGNGRDLAPTYEKVLLSILDKYREQQHDRLAIVVQLPGYSPTPPTQGEIGWSRIREQQRQVAVLNNANALVVTIDLGQKEELHPKNKQQIGVRIARAVSFLDKLGKPPGTQFKPTLMSQGTTSVLTLTGDPGRLSNRGGGVDVRGFEECTVSRTECKKISVKLLDDHRLTLETSSSVGSRSVFFCWGDLPDCTLLSDGLPVTPFFILGSTGER